MNEADQTLYGYRHDTAVPAFPDDKPLFVFDGVCVMCSSGAAWLMRHDKRQLFRFTSAQSRLGHSLYQHYRVPLDETYLLLHEGRLFGKSADQLRAWTEAGCYVTGPEIVAAGLAELLEL